MKLFFFLSSLSGGGAERATATLATHWANKGWDVTIATFSSADEDVYVIPEAVRRIELGLLKASSGGIDGLITNVRRVLRLRRALKSVAPTVVVSMMDQSNVILALARVGMTGFRSVGAERSYPPKAPLPGIWRMLRRRAYANLDVVVAQTKDSAKWLKENTRAKNVEVIPNAIVWPLPEAPPRVEVPDVLVHRRVLLAVGRLGMEKQHALLIDVFARLAPRFEQWRLVILGEGAERARLEEKIRSMALEDQVFLVGRAGNVGEWYERADLYVMCSSYEGMPNSLLEAMSFGVPVVSFDCLTGPRDVIRHGVDGVLVPADDEGALATSLADLMGDDDARRKLGQSACEVRKTFSVARVAGMWERVFAAPLPSVGQ
jgi:glycosyltransferase involved in cell wall biosynthesis